VNVAFGKTQFFADVEASSREKRAFCTVLRQVKKKILNQEHIALNTRFMPGDFPSHVRFVIPQRHLRNNWNYDLKASPLDYLPCMVYMMRFIEERNEKIPYHVFPQRTSLIPGYITLDTITLVRLFGGQGTPIGSLTQYYKNGNNNSTGLTPAKHRKVWSTIFKTDSSIFKKGIQPTNFGQRYGFWKFNNMITTDGFGCSILFNKLVQANQEESIEEKPDVYIQDADREELQGKRIVAIDPGKSDLLFCVSKVPPPVQSAQDQPPQVEM
jgi:hypothetical protein